MTNPKDQTGIEEAIKRFRKQFQHFAECKREDVEDFFSSELAKAEERGREEARKENCICKDRFCRMLENCDIQCMVCHNKNPYRHWEDDFNNNIADINDSRYFASGVKPVTVKLFIRKLIGRAVSEAYERGKEALKKQKV